MYKLLCKFNCRKKKCKFWSNDPCENVDNLLYLIFHRGYCTLKYFSFLQKWILRSMFYVWKNGDIGICVNLVSFKYIKLLLLLYVTLQILIKYVLCWSSKNYILALLFFLMGRCSLRDSWQATTSKYYTL